MVIWSESETVMNGLFHLECRRKQQQKLDFFYPEVTTATVILKPDTTGKDIVFLMH